MNVPTDAELLAQDNARADYLAKVRANAVAQVNVTAADAALMQAKADAAALQARYLQMVADAEKKVAAMQEDRTQLGQKAQQALDAADAALKVWQASIAAPDARSTGEIV